MHSLKLDWAGERFQLYAARAAYWARRKTLLIADVHLGKASAFRHAGIPVPEQVTANDLDRLSGLLSVSGAERLIVLGDLFHARTGQSAATLETFEHWRGGHRELEIQLTVGNHDKPLLPFSSDWGIIAVEELREPPFLFTHEVRTAGGLFGVGGHVHPAVSCLGKRVSCFQFSSAIACLPAFGSFTGTHGIKPSGADQIFAVNGDEIVQLSSLIFHRAS